MRLVLIITRLRIVRVKIPRLNLYRKLQLWSEGITKGRKKTRDTGIKINVLFA
jgi:hypothetical protein